MARFQNMSKYFKETTHQINKREKYKAKLENELNNIKSLLENDKYKLAKHDEKIISQDKEILKNINDMIDKNLQTNEVIAKKENELNDRINRFNNIEKIYKEKEEFEKEVWTNEINRIQIKTIENKDNIVCELTELNNKETEYNNKKIEYNNKLKNMKTKLESQKMKNYELRQASLNDLKKQKEFKIKHANHISKLDEHIKKNVKDIEDYTEKLLDIPNIKRQKNTSYYNIINQIEKYQNKLDELNLNIQNVLNENNGIEDNDDNSEIEKQLKDMWDEKENINNKLKELNLHPDYNIKFQYELLDQNIASYNGKIKICNEQINQLEILKEKEINTQYKHTSIPLDCTEIININKTIKITEKDINEIIKQLDIISQKKEENKIKSDNEDKLLLSQREKADKRLEIMTRRFVYGIDDEKNILKEEMQYIKENIDDMKETKKINDRFVKEQYKQFNELLRTNDIEPKEYFRIKDEIQELYKKKSIVENQIVKL